MIRVGERKFPLLMAIHCLLGSASVFAQSRESIDFGSQIQPILAKRCFACHGPDKAEAGLRLNERASAFATLDSKKQAIVPKNVVASELAQRIASIDDDVRMPPEGNPLTPAQVELIQRWIEQGAEWKEHWAFDAPQPHQPPPVNNPNWVINPIDAFILSKLEQNGLTPAPPAEKTALLRRVTFDLTGLPPTPEEVDAFCSSDSPDAYEKVVERLLESEHFGEQWARHWLDVVRYADTNSFERDGPKPNAWRYRDYVIRSFNTDKPYDHFVREQLAGDELPDGGVNGLIATGFYRLGQWDDEPADRLLAQFDGLDDIITTTSQGFLGLTVNCARCHDHKIDPIPQRDYYSLLAFFQGITPNGYPNPNVEQPIFENEAERRAYEIASKSHQDQLNQLQASISQIEKEFRDRQGDRDHGARPADIDRLEYRFYRDTWHKLPDFDQLKAETIAPLEKGFFDLSVATRETAFGFVFTGTLNVPVDGEYVFTVDSDDGSRLTVDGTQVVVYDGIHKTGTPQSGVVALKKGRIPIRLDYFQELDGIGLVVTWSGPGFEPRLLSAKTDNKNIPSDKLPQKRDFGKMIAESGAVILGQSRYDGYTALLKQLDELKLNPVQASQALCVTESGPIPDETMLFKRGNPQSPGEKVVPAFLTILGGRAAEISAPGPMAKSSGRRRALANWIASPDNRLTARVMVNRLWQHHFGRGIVRSPNNFGLLGDRPTHPELLDWLAIELMNGEHQSKDTRPVTLSPRQHSAAVLDSPRAIGRAPWQMKRIHKLIVMSNSYRMSSRTETRDRSASVDPLNNLFWRHDMRRLSAEEIRDSILAVAGTLNRKMYGPGVFPEVSDEVKAGQSVPGSGWGHSSIEDQSRRSVYVQVKRSLVLPILADFDFADTDSSCAARFTTTQPTQSLGMLNGLFLNTQAVEFAKCVRRNAGDRLEQQIAFTYWLALSHEPEKSVVDRGQKMIESLTTKHGLTSEKALEQFCLMVLNLNEFIYLD